MIEKIQLKNLEFLSLRSCFRGGGVKKKVLTKVSHT